MPRDTPCPLKSSKRKGEAPEARSRRTTRQKGKSSCTNTVVEARGSGGGEGWADVDRSASCPGLPALSPLPAAAECRQAERHEQLAEAEGHEGHAEAGQVRRVTKTKPLSTVRLYRSVF